MSLIPIAMPPGIYRNGTRYQAKGRWYAANRVRWHAGAMRPIGGWSRRYALSDLNNQGRDLVIGDPIRFYLEREEFIRDGHAWRGNQKEPYLVFGSNKDLYWLADDGKITIITPDGFVEPVEQDTSVLGYGKWLYGKGTYGTPRPLLTQPIQESGRWTFDTWGEELLGCTDWSGNLYKWVPASAKATLIAEAPSGINGFVVTQERIIMTIGSPSELRKIQWCDQEDYTNWTPNTTNQAGDFVLPGDGRLTAIVKAGEHVLILSETDAYLARYVGPPYIYVFDRVGVDCATRHRSTVIANGGMVAWFGQQNFWLFDGGLKALPCDCIDFLTHDFVGGYASKTVGWANTEFQELWWHYVSNDAVSEANTVMVLENYVRGADNTALSAPNTWATNTLFTTFDIMFPTEEEAEAFAGAAKVLIRDTADPDEQTEVTLLINNFPTKDYDNANGYLLSFSDVAIESTGTNGAPLVGSTSDVARLSRAYGEPDAYVCWNWSNNSWSQGKLVRTAAVKQGVYTRPVMVAAAGAVYDHELSDVFPLGAGAQSGPLELNMGDKNMAIRYVFPDTEVATAQADENVAIQFESRQLPNSEPYASAVYTVANPTPVRVMGREHMLNVIGIKRDWEFGNFRLDVAPFGTGFR